MKFFYHFVIAHLLSKVFITSSVSECRPPPCACVVCRCTQIYVYNSTCMVVKTALRSLLSPSTMSSWGLNSGHEAGTVSAFTH